VSHDAALELHIWRC